MRMPLTATARDVAAADLHARLRAFVARRVADSWEAEDVAQEVLMRLQRHLADLRNTESLNAFAYRIARNAITDHYRARARSRESALPPDELTARADEGVQEDAGDVVGRRELAHCLEPLVRRLPEPYRQALILTDLGDLTQAQAAEKAGVSVPGMKSRVQRARLQVRDLLTECCAVTLDATRQIADVERTGPCACTSSARVATAQDG